MKRIAVVLFSLSMLLVCTPASAQSLSKAKTQELLRLVNEAEAQLLQGELDGARFSALRALDIDRGTSSEGAYRVMFDVNLAADQVSGLSEDLEALRALPRLSSDALAWVDRARLRLQVHTLEGRGDAAAARALLDELEAAPLSPYEQVWLNTARWRVGLRQYEQDHGFTEGLAAIRASRETTQPSEQDLRWLEGADLRLQVLAAEWSCALEQAQSLSRSLQELPKVRSTDQAWAQVALARLEARLAAAGGDLEGARVALAQLHQAEPVQAAWALGFSVVVEYLAATEAPRRAQDQERVKQLWALLEPWQQGEPVCSWLAAPSPPVETPSTWVQLGVGGGVSSYAHSSGAEGETLSGADCADEACRTPQLNAQLAAQLGILPSLALTARVGVQEPWVLEHAALGPPLLQVHAALVWSRSRWALSLGPRHYSGLWLASNAEDEVQTSLGDWMLDLGVGLALSRPRLDLGLSLAANPEDRFGQAECLWSLRDDRPLQLGLSGALMSGQRSAAKETDPEMNNLDWRVGLSMGWRWELGR